MNLCSCSFTHSLGLNDSLVLRLGFPAFLSLRMKALFQALSITILISLEWHGCIAWCSFRRGFQRYHHRFKLINKIPSTCI